MSGQPLDDLRRRLALNAAAASAGPASETSLNEATPEFGSAAKLLEPAMISDRLDLQRTISNASTDASDGTTTTTGTAASTSTLPAAPRTRIRLNAVEVGKVAPAVAEDTTNAMGLFDIEARYRDSLDQGDTRSLAAELLSQSPTPQRRLSGAPTPTSRPQRFLSTYGEGASRSLSADDETDERSATEGNDPSIKQLLERTYLDQYREPLPELGPHVPQGVPRRKALRTSFPPRERTPTRPEGTLIAHLVEHSAAVTSITVSPDQLFFVTASDDGTTKVWDAMRLEKNVTSKSRQTFQQGGRIVSTCMLEHSHCIASASTNGTIWIHRVDVSLSGQMPRYGKAQRVRQYALDDGDHATCLTSYNAAGAHISLRFDFIMLT